MIRHPLPSGISLDKPAPQPIPIKIHTIVIFSDAKMDICTTEIQLPRPISFQYFKQEIQMAIYRNDDNITENLVAKRIANEKSGPSLVREALFFLYPSKGTLSLDIAITDDDTLKQALRNIVESAWEDAIQMWLIRTDVTALGQPVPAPVVENSELKVSTNVVQAFEGEWMPMDESVPDQETDPETSVRIKMEESDLYDA